MLTAQLRPPFDLSLAFFIRRWNWSRSLSGLGGVAIGGLGVAR
jgi:hypothetical protein